MFANVVADRYARALLSSCPDLATIERVNDELAVLRQTYRESRETRDFLLNPKIPPKIKTQILTAALKDKLSEIVMSLIVMLIEKRRQEIIPEIAVRYGELTDNARGVEHAEITVARPITADLEQKLINAIQRFSTRDVEIEIKVDPAILGGVKIRFGDRVVDGSLARRFEEIRRVMLAARLPRSISSEG